MERKMIEMMTALLLENFPEADHETRRERMLEALETALADHTPPALPGRPLRVSLLGRFGLQSSAGSVEESDWKTQKSMLLFAFLASRAGRPVPDGTLSGTFWADSDDDHARSSLRNALYQMRGTVAPLLDRDLELERNRRSRTVTLQHPVILDTEQFEAGVNEAADWYAQGMHAAALECLRGVMPHYRGELLEGFQEDWILTLRAHYADLHLRALHMMARCHLALGDGAGAEQVARYAITLDDLREDLHAHLIEALTAQGRRGEALRHYREVVAHFEQEIGTVPSTLHDIYDALLAEGPVSAPSTLQSAAPWKRDRARWSQPRSSASPRWAAAGF